MSTIRAGLFVGINSYDSAQLTGACADAERMSSFFTDKFDYVDTYVDDLATKESVSGYFDSVVEVFEKNSQDNNGSGVLVFFFSGHGIDRDGRQYLILSDEEEIDLAEIESKTRIPNVHRVFILDCCRVLGHQQNSYGVWDFILDLCPKVVRAPGRWLKNYIKANTVDADSAIYQEGCEQPIYIVSCGRGQVSYDGNQGGCFTTELLKALNTKSVKTRL